MGIAGSRAGDPDEEGDSGGVGLNGVSAPVFSSVDVSGVKRVVAGVEPENGAGSD